MPANVYPRTYVPADLVVEEFSDVEPLYRELLNRTIDSAGALERWLLDLSELSSVVDEVGARRYIDKSCHTTDPAVEARYLHFVETIEPKVKPLFFQLQKKFLDSPHRAELSDRRYAMLARRWRAEVEIYRDENVALQTEVTKLVNEYDKLFAAMTVTIDGKELTLQQAAKLLEEPDRARREEAWRKTAERRMRDSDAIDGLFDQILALRDRIARNAGMSDFRAYSWKARQRFDYTPEDCLRYADSVASVCMPLVHALDQQRSRDLAMETLRPWDLMVDPQNRPALRPFGEDEIEQFITKAQAVFERVSPALGADFASLRTSGGLDLDTRKGKQPGGYQITLEESRRPFIFMNAAGVARDVDTLLHEGGHAFHALAARDEPLMFLRQPTEEFCEVASMAMELFAAEHLDVFYDAASHARARRKHLEGIIGLLPAVALVDSFQHWLYTHPGHSREQRSAKWVELAERLTSKVDWTGLEAARATGWQRTLHLFHVPFYYIEYGIAQLGALQLWLKGQEHPQQALANYRAALALGGTRPLPELFAAAGIRFDFSERTIRPLVAAVRDELAALPR